MNVSWLAYGRATVRWELDRLLRRRRPQALRPDVILAARLPDPERPAVTADGADDGPAFTLAEECQLRILDEWRSTAGPGARECGETLADSLRLALPGVADADIARVLLALDAEMRLTMADQDDPEAALMIIADGLMGAAPILAELELALADRGRR